VNQLVWRLHRNQAFVAVGALAALAVVLLVTGITMADDYRNALASCAAQSCGNLPASSLFRGDGAIMDLVIATITVPLLFGLFWGAPLLAKEFEDGTHNLAWTQGVSRRRWLRANVAWALLAAALWGAALAALVSWWRFPENALDSRFGAFDIQGIVPVAYALFAVTLGIAVGSVVRRVLPSLAVTLGIFVAIRVAVGLYLRPHFLTPVTKVLPLLGGSPAGAWVLSSDMVNGQGQNLGAGWDFSQIPAACGSAFPGGKGLNGPCLSAHGFHQILTYQPDSRFWAFQGIEAGIFLALAVVLVGFTFWWVRSRDA
jgi:ABC-type transport system involved in multi-copper enzyme maturation permease subunit